jgi:hypothetical protein
MTSLSTLTVSGSREGDGDLPAILFDPRHLVDCLGRYRASVGVEEGFWEGNEGLFDELW